MGSIIFGWFLGWIFLVLAVVLICAFRSRRQTVERELRMELADAMQKRAEEAARRSKELLEEIKKDPQAAAMLETLERSAEKLIKRQGFSLIYPPGLPPEPFVSIIKAVAMNLDLHLASSKALHADLDQKAS